MASNELLPWATGLGANVLTNADYGALVERQQGVQNGIANPQSANSALRHSTFAAAMLGDFSALYSGIDTKDDGDIASFRENFVQAILNIINTPIYGIDNGSANHVSLAQTFPAITHVRIWTVVYAQISNANTGASDITVGGFGPFPVVRSSGAALAAGDLVAGGIAHMVFDGWQFQLLNWQDPGGVGSGGTVGPPPPAPPSNLLLAGRLPVYGSGRWILVPFSGYWNDTWLNNSEVPIIIPPGVTSIRVRTLGGGGGGQPGQGAWAGGTARGGGGGEFAYGVFSVTPGQTYLAYAANPGAGGAVGKTDEAGNIYRSSASGGNSYFKQSGGATLISANGGMAGDLGGAGGTGGSGGSFRAIGGAGSSLGGGGGAGSQVGQGGAGGSGGGGVGPSGFGGISGGGGSLWGPGDGPGPGKGGVDWQGNVAGRSAFKDGVSPIFPMDFFPGGGGTANGSNFTINSADRQSVAVVVRGQDGAIGGGGGAGLAPNGNFTGIGTQWLTNGALVIGGNGGIGGGGGGINIADFLQGIDEGGLPRDLRSHPYIPASQLVGGDPLYSGTVGGGHGGFGGGGGGGGQNPGWGGGGLVLIEW